MTIKVTFLGTSAQIPSATRHHPAILIRYKKENILVDCGEGTQRQFKKAKLIQGIHYIQQAVIYDEVDMIVKDAYVQIIRDILQNAYAEVSNRLNMKVTYTGEVLTGLDWWACH